MPTIRVRDWTKERIEEICEEESHSSHDSVIKSLLKDRELASFAEPSAPTEPPLREDRSEPEEKAFEDLTVLAELVTAENGVLFLWCPNCGNEIAHLVDENPLTLSVFEVECQRCLSRLDQHAIVGIEIGYPIERRIVENRLEDDLRRCVVDYWDRSLEKLSNGSMEADVDPEHLVWQFDQYVREFEWEWPDDVPVVGVRAGETYRKESTGELLAFLEPVSENRNALDDYEVSVRADEDAEAETRVYDAATITNLLVERCLYPVRSTA